MFAVKTGQIHQLSQSRLPPTRGVHGNGKARCSNTLTSGEAAENKRVKVKVKEKKMSKSDGSSGKKHRAKPLNLHNTDASPQKKILLP